mmetsp:Transcript_51536/g.116612  ORF Transcript_51536/g.116612 Transcript_51536/m.116612 type:complete len:256 (-) Transcript_51536:85-852(-)
MVIGSQPHTYGATTATALEAPSSGSGSLLDTRAHESCKVLGDTFGFIVQGLLFAVVMSILLLKWWLEKPRRQFKIFALDSSKQVVGAGAIHVANMVFAMVFSGLETAAADECAWYWVNIMLDTTLGVFFCWILLKMTEKLFGYDSGHYGKKAQTGIDWETNPDYAKWFGQIVVWCVIVSVMKLAVVVLMWSFAAFWEHLATLSTHWIPGRQLRLVFVMIVTPTFMNMFQFVVTDSFIKYSRRSGGREDSGVFKDV